MSATMGPSDLAYRADNWHFGHSTFSRLKAQRSSGDDSNDMAGVLRHCVYDLAGCSVPLNENRNDSIRKSVPPIVDDLLLMSERAALPSPVTICSLLGIVGALYSRPVKCPILAPSFYQGLELSYPGAPTPDALNCILPVLT